MYQDNWAPDTPYCVYEHISPSGSIYVGQTCRKSLCARFGKNGSRYINCPVFYKAILKYGWDNFQHKIIRDGLTKKQANSLEISEIRKNRAMNKSYNMTDGGGGTVGRKLSTETKRKISVANKGKIYKFTDEDRRKISIALMGKKHSPQRCLKNSLSHMGQKSHNKGKIMIHKLDQLKYIAPDELNAYIEMGWERGFTNNTRKKFNKRWESLSEDKKENIRAAQRNRTPTDEERRKKSLSHIKHGKYANAKWIK